MDSLYAQRFVGDSSVSIQQAHNAIVSRFLRDYKRFFTRKRFLDVLHFPRAFWSVIRTNLVKKECRIESNHCTCRRRRSSRGRPSRPPGSSRTTTLPLADPLGSSRNRRPARTRNRTATLSHGPAATLCSKKTWKKRDDGHMHSSPESSETWQVLIGSLLFQEIFPRQHTFVLPT